ncbi:hypothetical protein J5N97_013032 [Dioscorea zingiberensis]|uniref:DOG1 domain-containing protein n=1 Tax=Dioscorea zingiberensis TaxID=325984 RepID=A0A9D5CSQ7_9LILI|nr:hypothetical protein J5N97_013032 [Dioscorea zingiberensis]
MARLEQLLGELRAAPRGGGLVEVGMQRDLVARMLAHYHDYYCEKSRVAARDVLVLFSAPWLTHFERTFLWIAGWKPGLAFKIVQGGVEGMSAEQSREVENLRRDTAARERDLTNQMTQVQEVLATPEMLGVERGRRDGDEEGEALLGVLEHLVFCADDLRMRTVNRLVEILTPLQNLDMLKTAVELHLCIRRWGTTPPAGGGGD